MRHLIFACLLILSTPAFGQEQEHESPYAGMETRDIKALSDADIEGLMTGAGMGYAMAAELNGYPGPKHVLELADQLELTEDQRQKTEELFALMQDEAIAFGKQLIASEAELDEAFASQEVDGGLVLLLTTKIGRTEGILRAAHLRAHLQMTSILTMHQRHLYQELRGYGSGEMDHESGGHDH
jgi:Spy/CpxP family protein refolding chaperone